MSVEHLAVVLHHSKMSGTPKVVLLGIANHDGDGGAWPEIKTLAKYARVTVRNVQKAIQECVAAGELRVEPRWKMTSDGTPISMTNRYHLLVRCPLNCDRSFQHREIQAGQQGEASNTTGPPVADDTTPGVADDTTPLSETTPKPSLNRPSEPQTPSESVPSAQRPARNSRGTRVPEDFLITDDLKQWAEVKAPNAGAEDHEAFMDYWRSVPGQRGVKADWDATWRSWMRRASKDRNGRSNPGTNRPPRQSATDRSHAEIDAAFAVVDAKQAHAALNGSTQLQIGGTR